VVHWLSDVHAVHALFVQMGRVVVVQALFSTHSTHWPATLPLMAHTGLAPMQAGSTPPSLLLLPPSAAAPPSTPPLLLALAPGALQPWQALATQKALAGSLVQPPLPSHSTQVLVLARQMGFAGSLLHWLLVAHSTQRPVVLSHTGRLGVVVAQKSLGAWAQDTHAFCVEQ
jgi:hypothetical protein